MIFIFPIKFKVLSPYLQADPQSRQWQGLAHLRMPSVPQRCPLWHASCEHNTTINPISALGCHAGVLCKKSDLISAPKMSAVACKLQAQHKKQSYQCTRVSCWSVVQEKRSDQCPKDVRCGMQAASTTQEAILSVHSGVMLECCARKAIRSVPQRCLLWHASCKHNTSEKNRELRCIPSVPQTCLAANDSCD